MTSEIKEDTISEQTSANGVTIDGLTIKDGNIIGDVALAGTTPTFTIGDAGAEDAALIFDGNAQDFYIALDDSADDLIIGLGATVGTTPMLSFTEAKAAAFTGAVSMATTLTLTGNADFNGALDVDGTTNLDVVDIDGAVNMATTALVTGVLTTTAATVFNGGFTANDGSIITTADNTDTLSLISTDADAAQGPNLRLYRNSGSPADNDVLGMIDFEGRNDNSQDVIYVQMESLLADASDGTEDGYLNLSVMLAGTLRSRIEMDPGETVINEASQDLNFRVESNGKTHAIFVDAGNDHVNINTSDDLGGDLNVDGGIVVQNGSNLDQLSLISTDADANQGPNIRMYRNSNSPADDDTLGVVEFEGRNSASQDVIYSQIRTLSADVTDGEEDGTMDIKVMNAGSLNLVASFKGPETVINDASIDHDFRVESNGNANMLFVDGGNDRVHINGSTGTRELNVSGDNTRLLLYSTNNSTGAGQLQFGDENNEQVGRIMYEHNTNAMSFHTSNAEKMRITSDGKLSTGGEAAPDVGDGGLTLQQNAIDNAALTLKSSDVAHGMTDSVETDTYATFKKQSATKGGLQIRAFAEDNANERLVIDCQGDGNITTTKSASGKGAMVLGVSNKSSANQAGVNSNANLLTIANYTNTRFIFDAEGDFHADSSSTTYDAYDDAQLVRAYDLSHGKGVINSKFDKFVSYNHQKLADLELVGKEEDGTPNHFVNVTGMQRLHNGAIWQQYEKTERLTQAMYKLAIKTLGKEEADKLLDEEEIKLLN